MKNLEQILTGISDAFFTVDREWRLDFVNDAAARMDGGGGAADLAGKTVWEIFPDAPGTNFETQLRRAMNEKQPAQFEYFNLKSSRRFEIRASPFDGGLSIFAFDITGSKRAEQSLVERERLARLNAEVSLSLIENKTLAEILQTCAELLVKHLDAAFARVWTLDEAANILELKASAGIYTLLDGGHSRVPVSNETKIGTIAATRKPHLTNSVIGDEQVKNQEWARREGMTAFAGYPLLAGSRLVGVAALFARQPLNKATLAALAAAANIIAFGIEGKRAEEKLRESESQFRSLADSIPQLAWMAEADGSIFWYNERWNEYTGASPDEMAGWGWQSVHDPEILPSVLKRWSNSIATGKSFEMEFPLKRGADGAFRWFLTRVQPIRNSDGRIIRWFGTNTDIEEIRQARHQAEEASRLKDEFLATISHELRTPLNAILGWSQMLDDGKVGDAAQMARAHETIYRNARSQAQLIEDILDVSRIITGKLRLEMQPLALALIVRSAIDTVRPAIEAKSIQLEIRFDETARQIYGDSNRLRQVVWNLVSNAVKFTPHKGKVAIAIENLDSHLRLTVTDEGRGIEKEFLPFIFDRFRQEDATTTRRHGGLGLGLAIVRHLVELHGGNVAAHSDGKNRGATFIVRLPLLWKPSDAAAVAEEVETFIKTRNVASPEDDDCLPEIRFRRVLLVDDEADTLGVLEAALLGCQVEVRVCQSAAEALAVLREWKPEILVSDIAMPDEDGFSLIKKVRALAPEDGGLIPAIALTAYAHAEDREKVLAADFQMFLAKPIEPTQLLAAIASLDNLKRDG